MVGKKMGHYWLHNKTRSDKIKRLLRNKEMTLSEVAIEAEITEVTAAQYLQKIGAHRKEVKSRAWNERIHRHITTYHYVYWI